MYVLRWEIIAPAQDSNITVNQNMYRTSSGMYVCSRRMDIKERTMAMIVVVVIVQ